MSSTQFLPGALLHSHSNQAHGILLNRVGRRPHPEEQATDCGRRWIAPLRRPQAFIARPQHPKITLGDMQSGNGPRGQLICSEHKCSHSVVVDAASWGDAIRLSDLEPKFICKACRQRGADVRPLFERANMGTGSPLVAGRLRSFDLHYATAKASFRANLPDPPLNRQPFRN